MGSPFQFICNEYYTPVLRFRLNMNNKYTFGNIRKL